MTQDGGTKQSVKDIRMKIGPHGKMRTGSAPMQKGEPMNDVISRQAVLDTVDDLRDRMTIEGYCAMTERVKALPTAQPEQTDCEYCHEDSDGYVKPIEKNCHAFIRFGMDGWELDLSAKGWNGSAKIMYCPMCGRRLTDE